MPVVLHTVCEVHENVVMKSAPLFHQLDSNGYHSFIVRSCFLHCLHSFLFNFFDFDVLVTFYAYVKLCHRQILADVSRFRVIHL